MAGSALRVSHINVVAAIRDLPEDLRLSGSIGAAFKRPLTDLATAGRRLLRGRVIGALLALPAAPWHFIAAFRVFISRGPLLLAVAPLLINAGIASKELWPFSIGISLGLIGAAMLLRWIMAGLGVRERLRNRIGFSLAGILLVAYWLLPFDALRSDLNFDVEMFFISGMFLMVGGIWTVMYNIDLILGAALTVFGGLGKLTPIIRMAVTYPMQQRFRTGMTMFMFSLVLFSLVVESVLWSSLGGMHLDLNRSTGGYDTYGFVGSGNAIPQLQAQVAANPALRGRVSATGSIGSLPAEVSQPAAASLAKSGKTGSQDAASWNGTFALGIPDNGYFTTTRLPFKVRATGYTSAATLTAHGIAVPNPQVCYFRVAPGQDVHQTALAIGSAFLRYGIDMHEAQADYNQAQEAQVGFNELIQGFMALGLVVGIAALGVIATRAVVERRQQIGMMRALGFQRAMVRSGCLMESSVVAVLGTLVGVVLGLALAIQLIDYMGKMTPGLLLVIPWAELVLLVVGAYAASLLTTYLPARQASQVFPAEALRYE